MKIISSFTIANSENFNRISEPVNVAAPFPKGMIRNHENLCITIKGEDKLISSKAIVTGHWNDNSVKWINFEFSSNISSAEFTNYEIIETTDQFENKESTLFDEKTEKNRIGKLKLLDSVQNVSIRCLTRNNEELNFEQFGKTEVSDSCYKKVTEILFHAECNHPLIELIIRIHEYKDSKIVKIDSLIRNLSAAVHPGEFWDLNDENSLFFKELSLIIENEEQIDSTFTLDSIAPAPSANSFNCNDFKLVQQSSGGINWDCKTHIAAENKNYRKIKGAIIETDNKKEELDNISPTVYFKNKKSDKIAALSQVEFWQNFPSALIKTNKAITIGLFPNYCDEIFELQGGEQKKQTFWIKEFDSSMESSMQWIHKPLVAIFPPEWHEKCKIYPYMTAPDENDPKEYFELINNCINDKNSFAKRREEIDEYGWRNYGELYADHESSYLENGEFNVSHYNNQYDFANYAMVQFWRSSDKRWYFLADQLARHIRDIDTYHTKMDRFTFNGGIFWHTNHYVSAETATHRCYSSKTNPPLSGGISIQNCYINGLMTHYYTSADPDTYNSVMETIDYAYTLVMGPESIKDKFKYFLKENIKNFYYDTKAKITKQVFPYGLFQGPGRESGNALLILTKAFEFTKDKKYLKAAERILRTCISPSQNLASMRINEPEYRWMYLLFLQSLIEFIKTKEEINDLDSGYKYAVKSFDHYTEWMLNNEYSYLDKPETLEYPNETWAMQELRKPQILYEAAERAEAPEKKEQYIKMAEELYRKAFGHFKEYGDRRYLTRPLVLAVAYGLVPIFFKRKNKS